MNIRLLSKTMDSQEPKTKENTEQKRIVDIEVTDENVALNLLVSFCNLANQRGVFSLEEGAKIWECVKFFTSTKKTNETTD